MAASLFLPSPSFNHYRTNHACLSIHINQWQKGIRCLSICIQKEKLNFKACKIPGTAVGCHFPLKQFAAVGLIEAGVSCKKNYVCCGVSALNNFQRASTISRSETLVDGSNNPLDSMSEFERQLQELHNEVRSMIMMGNKNDAIDLLQANYEAVKEQMNAGAKGLEEAAVLDIIALGYMAIGNLKLVRSLLNMMSEVVDSRKDDDDEPLLDSILLHMGSMYLTLGESEKSMLTYRRVIVILESRYGKNNTLLITPILGMAKVFCSIGRTSKAVDNYHRAISILESSRGTESEDLVIPLFGLGNLLIKEGKGTDAEKIFMRILNIYKKLYGENDGRVGLAMCSLAHAKCAKGKADEAIDLYKSALQVIKNSSYMAIDDGILENMRIDLAELLHAVGRGKEGQELLEECLLIAEKLRGKHHPSLLTHYLNLATSYSQSKDFVMAERLQRTSLEIIAKTEEPYSPTISFPMLHLAVTLYHLKKDEEAEQLALEALHIREKAFGKDSLPVGEALDCLVSIQTRLGKSDAELLELLERVVRIQEKEFGHESEEVMVTLKKVVFYLDRLGRKDDKFLLEKRLSTLRTKFRNIVPY